MVRVVVNRVDDQPPGQLALGDLLARIIHFQQQIGRHPQLGRDNPAPGRGWKLRTTSAASGSPMPDSAVDIRQALRLEGRGALEIGEGPAPPLRDPWDRRSARSGRMAERTLPETIGTGPLSGGVSAQTRPRL